MSCDFGVWKYNQSVRSLHLYHIKTQMREECIVLYHYHLFPTPTPLFFCFLTAQANDGKDVPRQNREVTTATQQPKPRKKPWELREVRELPRPPHLGLMLHTGPQVQHSWKKERCSVLCVNGAHWPEPGQGELMLKISIAIKSKSDLSTRHSALAEGDGSLATDSPQAWLNLLPSPKEMEGQNVNNAKQHISTPAIWLRGYTQTQWFIPSLSGKKRFVSQNVFGVEHRLLMVLVPDGSYFTTVLFSSWSQRWMFLITQFE